MITNYTESVFICHICVIWYFHNEESCESCQIDAKYIMKTDNNENNKKVQKTINRQVINY